MNTRQLPSVSGADLGGRNEVGTHEVMTFTPAPSTLPGDFQPLHSVMFWGRISV